MERRKTALVILNEYETKQTYLNLALKSGLSHLEEGRKFVTELVYGVVRYRRFLDETIRRYASVPLKKLSIPVKNILRIGFYQIYFMDKIPSFAILNESVKLAEKFAYKSKGFVNAVLRQGLKKPEEEFPIWVKESFPDELYELLHTQYGAKTDEILHALNCKGTTVLRYHHMRYADAAQALVQLPGAKRMGDALIPNTSGDVLSQIQTGDFSVQSLPSQMAVSVLSPQSGERVLDCCAAPGGKTAYMGELMQNQGEIVACELHPHRCELVQKNLSRCGITIGTVQQGDAAAIAFSRPFDRILADVPCSGLGVIGSKPDIKWRAFAWESLISIQKSILDNICQFLKKDGILVYSTCTLNQEENERQIARFLEEHPGFSPDSFSITLNGTSYGQDGMAQILPDAGLPGFFIAKLKKNIE